MNCLNPNEFTSNDHIGLKHLNCLKYNMAARIDTAIVSLLVRIELFC